MAGIINLEHIVSEYADANAVEIYILPPSRNGADGRVIDVSWKKPLTLRGPFACGTVQYVRNYYHRDMCYSYDLENDGQKVTRKLAKKDVRAAGGLYAIVFQEEMLPPHRFPATKDITYVEEVKHQSYRINNRMFLYHDEEDGEHTYYIRYNHSDNVDLRKMQSDLDRALATLLRK